MHIPRPKVALTPAQTRAYGLVEARPGLTIVEAAKLLGCTHATATYHLNALLQRGYINSQRDGRAVRHFTIGAQGATSRYLEALCRDPRRNAVAQQVARLLAPATVNEVARSLGMSFGFVKRTLSQLETDALVRIERRRIWYLVSPTQRLLASLREPAASGSSPQAEPVQLLV
jgi:predicted transcriptional regulator